MNRLFLLKLFSLIISSLLLSLSVSQAVQLSPFFESPEPTVVSFQGGSVGNNICEDGQALPYHGPNIGEDYDNACWDCGCLVDEYCDGVGGSANADNWNCVPMLAGSGIAVSNVASVFFPKYDSFNRDTQFEYVVNKFPLQNSVDVSEEECSISSCVKTSLSGDTESCTAQCDFFGCSTIESDSFSRACTVEITGIDDYDSLFSYSVRPKISLNVSITEPMYLFRHGGQGLAMSIEGEFPPLNFGASYCGDGVVDSSESESTCCYDTGCGDGFYCDIDSAEIPMTSSCVSESSISLDASMGQRSFFDTTVEHRTGLDLSITGIPIGMNLNLNSAYCEFGGDNGLCEIEDCEMISLTDNEYTARCRLRIPPINFKESEFFDERSGRVVLKDGVIVAPITFTDGPDVKALELNGELDDVEIYVQTTCPDAVCDFDESLGQANECPADCGCPEGKYMVTENGGHRGVCVSVDAINLNIISIQPNPVPCIVTMDNININQFKGKLQQFMFTQQVACTPDPVTITATITGSPRNLEVTDSSITINNGETMDVSCRKRSGQTYTCPLTLRASSDQSANIIDLHFSTEFASNVRSGEEQIVTNEISDSGMITLDYRMAQDVQALKACYEQTQEIDNKINDLKKKKSNLLMIIAVLVAITTAALITCNLTGNAVACAVWKFGLPLTACISAPLLWAVGNTIDSIERLKNDKKKACAGTDLGGVKSGGGGGAAMAKIGAAIAAIVCIISIVNNFNLQQGAVSQTADTTATTQPAPTGGEATGTATTQPAPTGGEATGTATTQPAPTGGEAGLGDEYTVYIPPAGERPISNIPLAEPTPTYSPTNPDFIPPSNYPFPELNGPVVANRPASISGYPIQSPAHSGSVVANNPAAITETVPIEEGPPPHGGFPWDYQH